MSVLRRVVLGTTSLALVGFLGFAPTATFGQSPGNGTDVQTNIVDHVNVSTDIEEAAPGQSVSVSVDVTDANGNPVAGTECLFTVSSQPGTDATVDPASTLTDAQGHAMTTLDVGSSAGTIVVEADCGDVVGTVSVVVGAAAAPPASFPDTGTNSSDRGSGVYFWPAVAALAILAAGTAVAATARLRQR